MRILALRERRMPMSGIWIIQSPEKLSALLNTFGIIKIPFCIDPKSKDRSSYSQQKGCKSLY